MRKYKQLKGMDIIFQSGSLSEVVHPEGNRGVKYDISFKLLLDFDSFYQKSHCLIPGYLATPVNAIRPELTGLAYHYSYNYFDAHAGNIDAFYALAAVFKNPNNYMDVWGYTQGGMLVKYDKPAFTESESGLIIDATQSFVWQEEGKEFRPQDLPVIPFSWALNIMMGHTFVQNNLSEDVMAPGSVAILGYFSEERIEEQGMIMNKGIKYIKGAEMEFGEINCNQILIAGD